MNEPSNVPLRRLQARAEAEGIPIQFEAVSYVNLDDDTWIGVAAGVDEARLREAGFRRLGSPNGLSMAVRPGAEPVTVLWRPSQSTTVLVGFTFSHEDGNRVDRLIQRLQ